MTKQVRVENACTSNYQVVVETWDKGADGKPDVLASSQRLNHPTAMTNSSTYIHSSRYLVVREATAGDAP